MDINGVVNEAIFLKSRSGHFHLAGFFSVGATEDRFICTSRVKDITMSGDDHGMLVTTKNSVYLVPYSNDNNIAFEFVDEVIESLDMEAATDEN